MFAKLRSGKKENSSEVREKMKNGIIAFAVVVCVAAVAYALQVNEDIYLNGYSIYDVSSIESDEGVYIPIATFNQLQASEEAGFESGFWTTGISFVGGGVAQVGSPQNFAGDVYAEHYWLMTPNYTWCELRVNEQGELRCIS